MPRVTILDVKADPSVNFQKISLLPSAIPLSGLTHYWSPDSAVLSATTNRVNSISPWRGTQVLSAQYTDVRAPLLTQVNNKNMFVTNFADLTRLIVGTTIPNGEAVQGDVTAGLTVTMVVKVVDIASISTLCSFYGFRLRCLTTGMIQLQKSVSSTLTATTTFNASQNYFVLQLSHDRVTNEVIVRANGTVITTQVSAAWNESYSNTIGRVGIAATNSDGSAAHFGDILIYGRPLNAAESLTVSNYLKTKYAIA